METDEFFHYQRERFTLLALPQTACKLSGETLQKGDCKKLKNTSCQYYTEQPYPA